jgi:hypothetical protein
MSEPELIDSPENFEFAAEHKKRMAGLRQKKLKQDAKNRKPLINKDKLSKGSGYTMQKLRPIVGFAVAPYLIVRPVIRVLAKLGNWLFDQVFHPKLKK